MDMENIPLTPDEQTRRGFQASVEVSDYMVYKCGYVEDWDGWNGFTKRQCFEAVCTACGETRYYDKLVREGCRGSAHIGFTDEYDGVPVERFGGDEMTCPVCGKMVTCVHVSEFGASDTLCRQCGVMACMRKIDGEAVLISYEARRLFNKYGAVTWDYLPWEAYWIEEASDKRGRKKLKLHKACGYTRNYFALARHGWEERRTARTTLGDLVDWLEPFGYEVTDGTLMEKSGIVDYSRKEFLYLDRYMETCAKHPNLENVCKAYPYLCYRILKASEITDGYYAQNKYGRTDGAGIIDWKAVRPHEMLRMSREDARRAERERWDPDKIRIYRMAMEVTGEKLTDECMEAIFGEHTGTLGAYLAERVIMHGARIERVMRYVERNELKTGYRSTVSDLVDVWDMMAERGAVLDSSSMWPRSLKATHDREVDLKNARIKAEKEGKAKTLDARIGKQAEKLIRFSWVCGDLMIEPARSGVEMVAEGNHNHNCVATYREKVAEGQTTIWFIRRLSEPSVPFFTLEMDPELKTVRQNRGMRNCERTQEVYQFEQLWLMHIREIKQNKEVRANA